MRIVTRPINQHRMKSRFHGKPTIKEWRQHMVNLTRWAKRDARPTKVDPMTQLPVECNSLFTA
jgi:hypothetical protein